jgi:4-amino-4-deoxy-L-arabinose transferase-like glycosyltransferase
MSQRLWLLALLGALLLWFPLVGSYRLFNPDEGRYAEIPREMVASGDWVTPRLNELKYFEKPPLQYWATAVAYEIFGEHEWTARLWVALTGFLGLLLTAWVGTRLYGALTGALAALVQAGALLYLGLARISTLDMGLTVTLELALVGLLLLVQRGRTAEGTRLGALLLAIGVALAFLSKGLVGILIPGTVAVCYLILRRDWNLIWRARPWWTLLALALIAAPWVMLVARRNPNFAQFFFVHEQFSRFLTRVHMRYQPDWFFVPVLLLGYMPWTPLLPWIAKRSWIDSRGGDGASLVLAIWAVFCFVFFSLSQSKLIPYILPLFPALSLLAGRSLANLERRPLQRALLMAAALWATVSAAVLWIWHAPAMMARLNLPSGPVVPTIAASFLLAAAVTAGASWLALRRGALAATAVATLGSLLLVSTLLSTADQLPEQRHNRALVTAAAAELHKGTAFYCVDAYEQSIPFYLGRTCTLVGYRGELDFGIGEEPTRWIADLQQFAARWRTSADALAVIRPESYAQLQQMGLPMRVIYTAPTLVAVVRQ